MKRIYYAGGSALTSDPLADAVLEYAEALAKSAQPQADVVTIPVVLVSGHAGQASLLIGPASQLFTVSEDAEMLKVPDDAGIVLELKRRTRLVGAPRPMTQVSGQGDREVMHVDDEYE